MPVILPRPQVEVSPGYLYSNKYQDCYFQTDSPLDEIEHVFIQGSELIRCWDECEARGQSVCVIGETGFGSGLNFVVVRSRWRQWCEAHPDSQMALHYISTEFSPLSADQLAQVYEGFSSLKPFSDPLIDQWPPTWAGAHLRHFPDRVQLSLLFGDGVEEFEKHDFIADVWFLDGFSPRCDQRLWSPDLFQQLAAHSKSGTRLATFTAAGFVRRGLGEVGFLVVVQEGFHKRHMSKARFEVQQPDNFEGVAKPDPLNINPSDISGGISGDSSGPIAVIGAGYAGLSLAAELVRQGREVHIFDTAGPMSGASNNHAHLLYLQPKLIANNFNHFFEQAYSYSMGHYHGGQGVTPLGVFHVPTAKQHDISAECVAKFWPVEWLKLVSKSQASALIGMSAPAGGFWMPKGLMIQPKKWAQSLIERMGGSLKIFADHQLDTLRRHNGVWQLSFAKTAKLLEGEAFKPKTFEYGTVVLASGAGSIQLMSSLGNKCLGPDPAKQSHWRYPLRPIAGQSSELNHAKLPLGSIELLRAAICGDCYVTPEVDGRHSVGSTFHPDQFSGPLNDLSHRSNMRELVDTLKLSLSEDELMAAVEGGYAATRLQTTDFLPMVGEVFPELGGQLYLLAGFGAKGSSVAPFAAHLLASDICGKPGLVSPELASLVDPGRFAARMKKSH